MFMTERTRFPALSDNGGEGGVGAVEINDQPVDVSKEFVLEKATEFFAHPVEVATVQFQSAMNNLLRESRGLCGLKCLNLPNDAYLIIHIIVL